MRVGGFDTDRRLMVVAEIGNNHEGSVSVAEEMVRQAAAAGADAVKFQIFRTQSFVRPSDAERFKRLQGFELPPAAVVSLAALAKSLGLLFISTPLDLESAAVLEPLVDVFKIASGDNTFYPLIDRVVSTGKPLIVSCGLTDANQVERTVATIDEGWRRRGLTGDLALLHCVSAYPAPPDQIHLRAIGALAARFSRTVGYSDHTLGIEASVLAVACGARIIEKHFTLDKDYSSFRDHQLSADPPEMAQLVQRARAASVLLGDGEKRVQPCEEAGVTAMRRSIAAVADLPEAHVLTETDLVWLRPAGGLPPGDEHQVLGRALRRAVQAGEWILPVDII